MSDHQFLGQEAMLQTPQVFPPARRMKPFSPQLAPQEFLIHQAPPLEPIRVTPWLRRLEQLLNTPPAYLDQLVASTATDWGLTTRDLARVSQFLTSTYPAILQNLEVEVALQVCLTGLQGYSSSVVMLLAMTYLKALVIRPPLQAWLPQLPEQSTSSDSERLATVLSACSSFQRPSRPPVVENAQHEPHCPWFLTPVTDPLAIQSMSSLGMVKPSLDSMFWQSEGAMKPRQVCSNSSWVMALNWLMPMEQVSPLRALWALMAARFSRKMRSLQAFSNWEEQETPCLAFQASNSDMEVVA